MTEVPSKVPVKIGGKGRASRSAGELLRPMESLRREVDRLFEDFDRDFWRSPFRRPASMLERFWRGEEGSAPAVDIVEGEKAYEVTAELPGMDGKDIEVTLTDDVLTIKGEKREEKEGKEGSYRLSERHYGAFERSFEAPEGVDADKIEARFEKGVLKVTLPKKPEAQKTEKKIEIKTA
jgi:HSP20 family protein